MEGITGRVSRHDPELVEVEVPWCSPDGFVPEHETVRLVDALKGNPYVKRVDFYWSGRTPEVFRKLCDLVRAKNSAIEYVRLPGGTNNDELLPFVESLRRRQHGSSGGSGVNVLDLTDCDITGRVGGEIMERLLLGNQSIVYLASLGNQGLGSQGAACIARALSSGQCTLKKLQISECSIGNDGAREVSIALGGGPRNNCLEELKIGTNGINFVGFGHVVEMLEANTSLKVVVIKGNSLNEGRSSSNEETAGDLVVRVLRNNTTLRTLDISNCGLVSADASSLFGALAKYNQTLSSLNIQGNEIMDESSLTNFERFAPDMKGIEEFYFSWQRDISPTALRGVLRGLRGNGSLRVVRANDDQEKLLGEGSVGLWQTGLKYFASRNKMRPLLGGSSSIPAMVMREGRVPPPLPQPTVPPSLWPHLLKWCQRDQYNNSIQTDEVKASLIFHVLRTCPNGVFEMANLLQNKSPRPT